MTLSKPAVPEAYRKWRPSGRNQGKRCETSPKVSSIAVTGVAAPPPAGMRKRLPVTLGANTMTSFLLQDPPRGNRASSQRVNTGPPDESILLSFPPAKNARKRLSGDQKG